MQPKLIASEILNTAVSPKKSPFHSASFRLMRLAIESWQDPQQGKPDRKAQEGRHKDPHGQPGLSRFLEKPGPEDPKSLDKRGQKNKPEGKNHHTHADQEKAAKDKLRRIRRKSNQPTESPPPAHGHLLKKPGVVTGNDEEKAQSQEHDSEEHRAEKFGESQSQVITPNNWHTMVSRRHALYFQKSSANGPLADIQHQSMSRKLLWCGFWREYAMPFEIMPIDQETFDGVYTPELTNQLSRFIHPTREWFDLNRRRWVVDDVRNAYFLEVSLVNGEDWAFSYLLIQGKEFALVQSEGHCRYSFVTLSPGFSNRPDEAENLVAQALRVGGVFLDGCYSLPSGFGMNLPDINAVPQAEFINRKLRSTE